MKALAAAPALLAALVAMLPATACAAGAAATPEVEAALARIAEAHRGITSLRARFVQEKEIAIVREPLRSSGVFLLDEKGRVVWRMEEPDPARFVILPEGVFANGERVRSGPAAVSPLPFLERMGGLLAGMSADVTRDFEVSLAGADRLRFVPREPALRRWIVAISIAFEPERKVPASLRLEEPGGDVTEIRFFEVEVNPELPEGAFAP